MSLATAQVTDLCLPARWAFFLVNGDKDGYSDDELAAIENWLEKQSLGPCLKLSDTPSFRWTNDSDLLLGGDCLDFTFALRD